MREIKFIVVHCSATPEGKKFEEKDIEAMHALRFKAIGGKHIGCLLYTSPSPRD